MRAGRRLVRLVAVVAAGLGAALVVAPPTIGQEARPPDSLGWWWKGNGGYPVPLPSPAPATEEGQVVVAGAPDGATAIAAIRYTLAEGEIVENLVFDVAPGGESAATAVILACQAGSGWTGEAGGPWNEKPAVDCASGSVQGIFSGDEATFTFPVGPLQFGDQVNVTLVAGTVEDVPPPLNGSSFQVVLEHPVLATTAGTPPVPDLGSGAGSGSGSADGFDTGDTASSSATSDSSNEAAGSGSGGGSFPASSPSGSADTASFAAATPALPADEQGQTATAPILQSNNPAAAAPPAAGGGGVSSRDTRLLGVGLLVAGAIAYLVMRRPDLVIDRLSGAGFVAAADGPPVEGIGRFARPRSGSPPSLT